jgi:hypothetical protein
MSLMLIMVVLLETEGGDEYMWVGWGGVGWGGVGWGGVGWGGVGWRRAPPPPPPPT